MCRPSTVRTLKRHVFRLCVGFRGTDRAGSKRLDSLPSGTHSWERGLGEMVEKIILGEDGLWVGFGLCFPLEKAEYCPAALPISAG